MLEKIKSYKKEKHETKDYLKNLNLSDARLKFAIRSKMTKTVQMNFKGDQKYAKNHWRCLECQTPDTQEHIVRCPFYQHLRVEKNMNFDKDLVDYF